MNHVERHVVAVHAACVLVSGWSREVDVGTPIVAKVGLAADLRYTVAVTTPEGQTMQMSNVVPSNPRMPGPVLVFAHPEGFPMRAHRVGSRIYIFADEYPFFEIC